LRDIPIFKRCPKVIFIFTAPQNGDIPANIDRRISELLSWIMPNLNQARYAIVRGTTSVYTLSVFMQGSVVLCPEVLNAISDYLYLCWTTRQMTSDQYRDFWDELMYGEGPVDDQLINQSFGEWEDLAPEFEGYDSNMMVYEQNWQTTIEKLSGLSNSDISALRAIRVSDCRVNFREVAAAVRYLRIIHNVEARAPVPVRRPR
jgi:hypothetical protein